MTVKAQKFLSDENVIFLSDLVAPAAINAVDLDGDADTDIIAALEAEIFWYENKGGEGIFDTLKMIRTLPGNLKSLQTGDLNVDDRVDIIFTIDRELFWLENDGNNGNYKNQVRIDSFSYDLKYVFISDLDGDGDNDLLTATRDDNKLTWYENTDGQASFVLKQVITTMADFISCIYAADIDGDGDMDVLSASSFDDKIAWYENTDGSGNFGEQQVINSTSDYALSVYSADLDGDGDMDVLSASAADDKIAWYENTDGMGTFSAQIVIATTADYPQYVYASDVDGDGDQDVFSASFFDDKVAWYENMDGAGNFGAEKVISELADQAGFAWAGDLDGDGDFDVITASCDFKISWHENSLPLQILKNPVSSFVYPDSSASLSITANNFVSTFRWQVDEGSGFVDINDSEVFTGSGTENLYISAFKSEMSGYKFRCITGDGENSLVSDPAVLISAPGDQIRYSDKNCEVILPKYTGGLDYTQLPPPYSKLFSTTKVTLVSNDTSENAIDISFYMIVTDSISPIVEGVPETQTLVPNDYGEVYLPNYMNSLVISDNCTQNQNLAIVQTPSPYTSLTEALTEVTLSVSDDAGNKTEVKFNVTIKDEINPSIVCKENLFLTLQEGQDTYKVTGDEMDPVSVYDNFKIQLVSNSYNDSSSLDGAEFPAGTTNVVWKVTDASGNEAECNFDVIVSEFIGLKDLKQSGISVYPNPSDGKFYFESQKPDILRIRVFDPSGRILMERSGLLQKGIVDLSRYSNGIFHCVIITESGAYAVKIVKE